MIPRPYWERVMVTAQYGSTLTALIRMVFGLNAESGPYQDLASAITLAARALTSPLVIGTPAFQSEENRAAFANIWDAAVDEMYRRQHADALALLEEIAVEDDD